MGNSLPMLLLTSYLRKKRINVQVFDSSNYPCGAWKTFNYKNIKIRRQSNVVVPINQIEDKNQKKINNFLKENFEIKIKKISENIFTNYSFKNKFSYNFDNFLHNISDKKIYKKITVKKINIKNKKIKINSKYTFDYMFIPTYFGIDKIYSNDKTIKTNFKIIQSEHVVALINSNCFNNIFYSDYFNNFFDRVQFTKEGKFFIFSARITKNYKGANIKTIRKELEKIFSKREILKVFRFKYKNFYRDSNQILELKKINKHSNIKYFDTQSFLSFSIQLINFLK